uniref:Uncharacterized protein n=1 Tax=Rhizophora mucronata TaxID=61149 RepID=A0A2P2Q844_RHIMU
MHKDIHPTMLTLKTSFHCK